MTPTRLFGPSASSGNVVKSLGYIWKTSHGPEYVGTIILLAAWLLLAVFVKPFHQLYFANDPRISYPYAEVERVSAPMLAVYAAVIPGILLVAYNITYQSSRTKHEATYLSFIISFTLAGFITHMLKNSVGRPRPDFLSRCLPMLRAAAGGGGGGGSDGNGDATGIGIADAALSQTPTPLTVGDCTAAPGFKLEEGWRSFPSGHASFAFAGLAYLAFFTAGQLHVFRPEDGGRDLGRTVAFLLPLVAAAWIGITRCEDYRHDVYDVGVGSVIGASVAYWSYRRHWPSLTDRACDDPYPHPSLGADGWNVFRRVDTGVEMYDLERA